MGNSGNKGRMTLHINGKTYDVTSFKLRVAQQPWPGYYFDHDLGCVVELKSFNTYFRGPATIVIGDETIDDGEWRKRCLDGRYEKISFESW